MESTTHTKTITREAKNDFRVDVSGEFVGYASSYLEAMELANTYVHDQLELEARAVVEVAEAAPASPLAAITRESVHEVVVKAKAAAAEHTRWLNALTRAEDALLSNQWLFTGTTLKIHSKSRKRTYTVSGNSCQCEAGLNQKPCYHVAAWRILVRTTQAAAA